MGSRNRLSRCAKILPAGRVDSSRIAFAAAALGAVLLTAGAQPTAAPSSVRTGASYSYACADLSHTIIRSNGGAPMQDFILPTGSACLRKGAVITIRNADPKAWLTLYGTLVQYPDGILRGFDSATHDITFIEGGILLGGGCAACLSVTFIKPGSGARFVFDGVESVYPNGTVGRCKGCAPDMAVRGMTWHLAGASRSRREIRKPAAAPEAWTSHPQSGCCSCIPLQLWGTSWNSCNAGAPWSLATASNPALSDVLRLELRQGDRWPNDLKRGQWYFERALAEGTALLSNGTTYWEAYAFLWECAPRVGSDGRASGSYWLVIENIHSNPKIANGVVPIETELLPGGYLAINARLQNGNHQNYIYIAPQPLRCGVWHDVVRQFDIDPAGGFLNEWLDGAQIVNFTGKLGDPGDTPYPVFELYRADYYGTANTYAERIAQFEIGQASLAGRIAHPPIPRGGGSTPSMRKRRPVLPQ